mmetsp:Transcript_26176/g.36674  ORF Transcript_26176/g.36674 Transcript_26176/m.36674 type:complete len:883 (+) Transcript_26176:45-2693(+)
MAVDLEKLKAEVEALGEKVQSLKSAGDKDAIPGAVKELLEAKKKYADNNNGIGVDGKPYEEPLTKAQKKAKAKAEKAAAAAAAAEGGDKAKGDPESAGSKKKAEKKEAAKAKKAAMKAAAAGGGDAGAAGGKPAGGGKPAAAAAARKSAPIRSTSKLQPLQVAINPNLPLNERPVVALTVAILTNTIIDLNITSDHMIRHTALGLQDGGAVVGDMAMARYLARRSGKMDILGGSSPDAQAAVDAWVDYAKSLYALDESQRVRAVSMTLENALQKSTYLVGCTVTMADIAVFGALGFPSEGTSLNKTLGQAAAFDTARRWISMMAASSAVREATQICVAVAGSVEASFDGEDALEPLAEGMNYLEGATSGRVVTRFPPEPSGYLHIGHAKAVLLNDYYARRYKGRLIVRFDDTNPSKEKEEFQSAIVEDLERLGVKPDVITFTSDYFETIRGYAEYLIQNGLAFMDDTPQEQMKEERMNRQNSKHRDQTSDECMNLFKIMCKGGEEGVKWCLRAKIDMQSVNGTMRDPVLYRSNDTPHHRSGSKFKAYPTYDLACPIVDSIEGVTHALRTTEYNDRDEQYQWIQSALGLRRVRIHAFARMNFMNTELSKRKLAWFVDNGYVTGWDDPRFPTVRGVVRRGMNILALRNFMYSQGASRRIVNMEMNKFWAENKKEIDKTAKRFMAIDKEQHVKLVIANAPEESDNALLSTDCHPKNPSLGKRVVRIAKEVLLESVDAEGIEIGEEIVLIRWGVVKITKVDGDLEGTFNPDGDVKAAKKKLSWIANVSNTTPCVLTEFDNLLTKEKMEEGDNYQDHINPNTLASSQVVGDPALKTLQEHDIIQLERRGYYRVDRPYVNNDKPICLYMVPDGRTKSMGGLASKLAKK